MRLDELATRIRNQRPIARIGTVTAIRGGTVEVAGLGTEVRIGDIVRIFGAGTPRLTGEVVAIDRNRAQVMTYLDPQGTGIGGQAVLEPPFGLRPHDGWIGRIIDAFGAPLDGQPLAVGPTAAPLRAMPPRATARRPLGGRLRTGIAAMDTMLPLVRGQRIGIFAGSGVGKSTLLAEIARETEADTVVLALIGERGRELRHFIADVLGPRGMARAVVVAATADQSPLVKRRAGWTAMAVAEHFRNQGRHVLLIMDSLTRLAEAHREIALTSGEPPALRAFPPSTGGMISTLVERAGPGDREAGDITGVFSVLVAGSDMEEPVADIVRGVLDGHIVLDREIAERGRFPAIDVRRSVSRALPDAASEAENELIRDARRLLGTYEGAAPMIQSGLYTPGADGAIDRAIRIWPALDRFFEGVGIPTAETAFRDLAQCLGRTQPDAPAASARPAR